MASSHHTACLAQGGKWGTRGTPSLGQDQLVGCCCLVRWTLEVPVSLGTPFASWPKTSPSPQKCGLLGRRSRGSGMEIVQFMPLIVGEMEGGMPATPHAANRGQGCWDPACSDPRLPAGPVPAAPCLLLAPRTPAASVSPVCMSFTPVGLTCTSWLSLCPGFPFLMTRAIFCTSLRPGSPSVPKG